MNDSIRRGASRTSAASAAAVAAAVLLAACTSSAMGANDQAGAAAGCRHQEKAGGDSLLLTTTCPARVGSPAVMTVTVRDPAGHLVTGATVTMQSAMPAMGMSGSKIAAVPEGGGYRARVLLGMSGMWKITVTVVPPGGDPVVARFPVTAS